MATLRDLALLGEAAARRLLESSGLASADGGGRGGRSGDGGGRGGGGGAVAAAAAMRALSAIPVVTDVEFRVRAAGGDGAEGVSEDDSVVTAKPTETLYWTCTRKRDMLL